MKPTEPEVQSVLNISAANSAGKEFRIFFNDFDNLTERTYNDNDLSQSIEIIGQNFYALVNLGEITYKNFFPSIQTLTITELDKTNKTISGTFAANISSTPSSPSINIVDGSFTKIPYTE